MKEATRSSGPWGLRTGSVYLIAQPDRASRKCQRVRHWAVTPEHQMAQPPSRCGRCSQSRVDTQSHGDPGRPEGRPSHGDTSEAHGLAERQQVKNKMERPKGHLQRSDSEIFGKTQVQGERKTNLNVFVVSDKSRERYQRASRHDLSFTLGVDSDASTRVQARVHTRVHTWFLAQDPAWPALFRVSQGSSHTPS